MDGTVKDGLEKVRIARATKATVAVEIGNDPRRVFLRLLVVISTALSNLVGKFGVRAKRVLGNMGFDRVTGIDGKPVVHVTELSFAKESFELVMATGDS